MSKTITKESRIKKKFSSSYSIASQKENKSNPSNKMKRIQKTLTNPMPQLVLARPAANHQ